MGSSRAEEQKIEYTKINSQGVDDIEVAGEPGAGTSLAGEKQVNPGDVAAPNPTVQQHGAGDQAENERTAKERRDAENERVAKERRDAVFGAIEIELNDLDELENLLAKHYRDSEKERKEREKAKREELEKAKREEREKARRKRGGTTEPITTPKPAEKSAEEPAEEPNECYIEIKNLVLIDESAIHKKALKEWDRKRELFASRVERKSTKVESRKNEVYQLIGFFSVFQGVLLTAVSQSNLLHCNNWWSPILLSVLASIVTIAGVFQKLIQIWSLEETIYSEEQALKDVVHRDQELRRKGKDFVFAKFSENKKKGSKEGYSVWYAVGVLSFLVVFAAVFPLSHWRILCDPGRNPYGGAPPPA